jgi:predicted nuclease of predicted toxin-antitoxin system
MRFIVDECTGTHVAVWLRQQGHEVFSVFDEMRGADDETILKKAFREKWILITNDKDFGEKIFRQKKNHCGIILLRLVDERALNKIDVLKKVLKLAGNKLNKLFVVSTEKNVRFKEIMPLL